MRKILVSGVAAAVLATSGCAVSSPVQELSAVAPYPQAGEGYQRQVIWLPAVADEDLRKVELLPGREMLTDCNIHAMTGQLDEHTLEGWGYTYYRLAEVHGPVSTMMACPGQEKTLSFVPVRLENSQVRYNSKLPIVFYAPQGIELRYRIWVAGDELHKASQE